MNDQGALITRMATEMLKAGVPMDYPDAPPPQSINLKTLYLTAIIAAAGGGFMTTELQNRDRPVSRYEKIEIEALIFYTAQTKGIDQTQLRHEVEQKTGVSSLNDLTSAEFPAVRRYLQEKAQ